MTALVQRLLPFLLVIGQLLAFAHQAATRHVTCASHGEELETATLAEALHACGDDHLVAVDGGAGVHADCAIARALHQSGAAPGMWMPAAVTLQLVDERGDLAARPARSALALYRIAPKTSPPV